MKLKKIFLLFIFVLGLAGLVAVEHSIIPQMTAYEAIENLPKKKYSSDQYSKIKEALSHKDECIRFVTYNLLANDYDYKQEEKQYQWPKRLPRIVSLIEEMKADVIGVQEPSMNQVKALIPYLEATYSFYAKPLGKGEHCGIFYKKDRFVVVDSRILEMPSESKEHHNKMLTMLTLKDLRTNKLFTICNAHLSFSHVESRALEAHFIAKQAEDLSKKMPVLFMGDLNTFPHRLDLKELPFYDGDYIHRILTESVFTDSRELSLLGHIGPIGTFTNDGEDPTPFRGTGTPGIFLDHIYVSKGFKVLLHAVQPGKVDGHYPSDHMPVIADVIIE